MLRAPAQGIQIKTANLACESRDSLAWRWFNTQLQKNNMLIMDQKKKKNNMLILSLKCNMKGLVIILGLWIQMLVEFLRITIDL